MAIDVEQYRSVLKAVQEKGATLVAVSKTKPVEDILELYGLGQRDFGENYVQELLEKQEALPKDIRWHFIGHLQSNKVKYIAPCIHLVHGIDSAKLLKEVNKEAIRNNRTISVLLQVHIAAEETKFGWEAGELLEWMAVTDTAADFPNVKIEGLMGMASFTENAGQVRTEFRSLATVFKQICVTHPGFTRLSMGMSGDYALALEEGSTMVRIGSLLFGSRN